MNGYSNLRVVIEMLGDKTRAYDITITSAELALIKIGLLDSAFIAMVVNNNLNEALEILALLDKITLTQQTRGG